MEYPLDPPEVNQTMAEAERDMLYAANVAMQERISALEAAGDLLRRELIVLANTEARKAATDYAVEAWDAALGA